MFRFGPSESAGVRKERPVPRIQLDNHRLHYWLSGQGPDLVLVHGLGGNLAGWHLAVVPELQREFRILTYDLRGHGRSDAPSTGYTTGDMARDLRGLLDALGIRQAAFVGHSWGADVVLHFALSHPERLSRMVLVEGALLAPLASLYRRPEWGGWPYASSTIERLVGQPIPEEHRCDLDYLLRKLIEIPILYGPAQGRPRDEDLVFRVMDVLRPMWQGRGTDGNMSLEDLSSIEQPALLVYESNTFYPEAQQEMQARLRTNSTALLPASSLKHFSTLEHPRELANYVRAFLRTSHVAPLDPSPVVS